MELMGSLPCSQESVPKHIIQVQVVVFWMTYHITSSGHNTQKKKFESSSP